MKHSEIISKYKDQIKSYHEDSLSISDITKNVIEQLKSDNIEFDTLKTDSLRRQISMFVSKNLQDDESTEDLVSKIEEALASKIDDTVSDTGGDFSDEEFDEYQDYKKNLEIADNYYYDKDNDSYIVYFPNHNKPYKFTGTMIREMKDRYSEMKGSVSTINQICREFKVPRNIFIGLKTILGWTHDDDPFTDEEYFARTEDDMVEDLLQRRKFSFFQKFNNREQKLLIEAAQKWWSFEGLTLNPFIEKYDKTMKSYEVPKLTLPEGDKHACVISPFDLHFGKYSWSGEVNNEYNRNLARKRLINATQALLADISKYNIEKFIVPVGSDFFHIDTLGGTTTKGTPQDCDGTFVQIMVEGNKLMIEFIDMLRQVSNVEILLTAGNHDFKLSHALLQFLGAYYKDSNDVNLIEMHQFRQYYLYGKTLLGFTHGDCNKLKDLPLLMANEAKEMWAKADFKAFFTGHLHHEHVKDVGGIKLYQMPSLSGSDRWHHYNGYEHSDKGMAAYIVSRNKGVKVNLLENIKS
jgi:predicted phosphodiesterase